MARNMRAFYSYSYSENAISQSDPKANILDIVQHIGILYYMNYSAPKLSQYNCSKTLRASKKFFQRHKWELSKKKLSDPA